MAPAGSYSYIGNIGFYPDSVITSDDFPFVKLPGDGIAGGSGNWTVTGWEEPAPASEVSEPLVMDTWPNPLNPSSRVRLQLKQAADLEVAVYDIRGRLVENLHSGFMPAGECEFTFSGNLPTGIYFIKAVTPGFSTVNKVIMLK